MKRLLFFFILFCTNCYAQPYIITSPLEVRTTDGTSISYPYQIQVSAGTFSTGRVWVQVGGAGGAGGLTGISGTSPIFASGGSIPSIWVTQASSISSGYLSAVDWNTFASTQAPGGGAGGLTGLIGTSPILTTGGSVPTISIIQASSIASGYLSVVDWNTFAGTGGVGGLTGISGTSPLFASGGTVPSIWIIQASSISSGFMSSALWNTLMSNTNAPDFGGLTGLSGTAPLFISGGSVPSIWVKNASSISTGLLTRIDWNTFANTSGAGGLVGISGTLPIFTSGGSSPSIWITQAGSISDGYLSRIDWNTFATTQAPGGGAGITGLTGVLPIVTGGGSVPSVSFIASGTSGQVMFNSSGSLAGDFGLVWDNSRKILTISGGSASNIFSGIGAGSSPTLSLIGSDNHGSISVLTGSSPSGASPICIIAFGSGSYSANPAVVFSPSNSNASYLGTSLHPYLVSGTSSFTLISGSAGLSATTQYIWNYVNNG